MNDKCYSINEEDFDFDNLEEAAQSLWGHLEEENAGDHATIWEGTPVKITASSLSPCMAEHLSERAYAKYGEHSENWTFTKEKKDSIQSAVDAAIDKWADENKMQPLFYGVEDLKLIQIKFTSTQGDFEIISEKL